MIILMLNTFLSYVPIIVSDDEYPPLGFNLHRKTADEIRPTDTIHEDAPDAGVSPAAALLAAAPDEIDSDADFTKHDTTKT